jgi:hypothetical protein
MPPSGAFLLKMKDLLATVVRFVMLFIFSQVSPELLQKSQKSVKNARIGLKDRKG